MTFTLFKIISWIHRLHDIIMYRYAHTHVHSIIFIIYIEPFEIIYYSLSIEIILLIEMF